MKIEIITVGKLKERYLEEAVGEYRKRLQRFAKVSIMEVRDEPVPENPSPAEIERVLQAESNRIKEKLKESSYIIALDIYGEKMTSEGMARKIENLMLQGKSRLAFIIGGTLGLHSSILSKAHWRLSFSDLTFPHQLMRVILLEQLYRCFTIIKGGSYHR